MAHTIKTRIQLKNDTEANWDKAKNFCPLSGEIIIYSTDESHPFSRLKVGDGVTNVTELPFVTNGRGIYADTTANFRANPTFIPNKGDIVVWLDKEQSGIPGIKIGDGLAYNVDLPFVGDEISQQLVEHAGDDICHITAAERQTWNNKINCEDIVSNEILILNRN